VAGAAPPVVHERDNRPAVRLRISLRHRQLFRRLSLTSQGFTLSVLRLAPGRDAYGL